MRRWALRAGSTSTGSPSPTPTRSSKSCASGPIIEKTRFVVEHEGHAWEIDVFDGENSGLVVAEIELESADEEFALPAWAGEDVTGDVRYYNQRLVEHPYSRWGPTSGS